MPGDTTNPLKLSTLTKKCGDFVACFHPLKGWLTDGVNPETGRPKYVITSYEAEIPPWPLKPGQPMPKFVAIPCGQCMGCRIDRSREWANRCLMELQDHPEGGYFVTCTYDDFHVPRTWYSSDKYGTAVPAMTLSRRDQQLFLKRLRKNTGQQIRFFGCGEYGPQTMRPHFHFILFGLQLDDLKESDWSGRGYKYYESEVLNRAWSFPCRDEFNAPFGPSCVAGRVLAGRITWETCAYTARYVTKKLTGFLASHYDYFNIEPPFSCMSLKPGIGRLYYDKHPDLYEYDFINLSTESGGKKVKPPRYFDKLFDIDRPHIMPFIKQFRQEAAELNLSAEIAKSGLDYLDYLQVKEDSFEDRIKALQRSSF